MPHISQYKPFSTLQGLKKVLRNITDWKNLNIPTISLLKNMCRGKHWYCTSEWLFKCVFWEQPKGMKTNFSYWDKLLSGGFLCWCISLFLQEYGDENIIYCNSYWKATHNQNELLCLNKYSYFWSTKKQPATE